MRCCCVASPPANTPNRPASARRRRSNTARPTTRRSRRSWTWPAQDRWEEAQTKADALYQETRKNPIIDARPYLGGSAIGQQRREQALEDKIREIDAKNSVFNPTIKSLLTENKDRGLPPRKDVRDAVDRIENTP